MARSFIPLTTVKMGITKNNKTKKNIILKFSTYKKKKWEIHAHASTRDNTVYPYYYTPAHLHHTPNSER